MKWSEKEPLHVSFPIISTHLGNWKKAEDGDQWETMINRLSEAETLPIIHQGFCLKSSIGEKAGGRQSGRTGSTQELTAHLDQMAPNQKSRSPRHTSCLLQVLGKNISPVYGKEMLYS